MEELFYTSAINMSQHVASSMSVFSLLMQYWFSLHISTEKKKKTWVALISVTKCHLEKSQGLFTLLSMERDCHWTKRSKDYQTSQTLSTSFYSPTQTLTSAYRKMIKIILFPQEMKRRDLPLLPSEETTEVNLLSI